MRALRYIMLLLVTSLIWGCQGFDEHNMQPTVDPSTSDAVVTRLADGRLQVRGMMKASSMTQIATRATVDEDIITEGWCLLFGQDAEHQGDETYSEASPLIQKQRVTINANGEFVIVLSEYAHTSFMRIVANLTEREKDRLGSTISWLDVNTADGTIDTDAFSQLPTAAEVSTNNITTFKDYLYQSVGLDGIYQMDNYDTKVEIKDVSAYEDLAGNTSNTALVYITAGGKAGNSTIHNEEETYNKNQPDPSSPVTTGFPMSSYGMVLSDGITEESLKESFGSLVYMIRACSKVTVEAVDNTFTIKEVYLLGAAQESSLRSTVLSLQSTIPNGTVVMNPTYGIPEDLGGSIDYIGLSVADGATKSDPIYFYPNKGGNYPTEGETSDPTSINPQYVIVYGQSSLYDSPGYYKLALKAQYPLEKDSDEFDKSNETKWSALTYDILRNTSFNIRLLNVDKQGYKTYNDAISIDSPASNINYSIEIESEDNRHEILVSNGTYYAELESSRVYVKGYMADGVEGCYVDFKMISSPGFVTPAVYIQGSGYTDAGGHDYTSDDVVVTGAKVLRSNESGYASPKWWSAATNVDVTTNNNNGVLDSKWVKIKPSEKGISSRVRVYFNSKGSGRLRLRIGDMLKFIPVVYDPAPISIYGTKGQNNDTDPGIVVRGDNGVVWSDFSYRKESDITYYYDHVGDSNQDPDFKITQNGTVTHTNTGVYTRKPELRARIHPSEPGDGVAVLYLRQASDFKLLDENEDDYVENDKTKYFIDYTAQGTVTRNATNGLFITQSDGKQVLFDASNPDDITSESVDALTISVSTKTIVGTSDNKDFFRDSLTNGNQTLFLKVKEISYKDQAYTDKPNDMILNNYKALSTITVSNSAGDHKLYYVNQTQYPPVYLVAKEGGSTIAFIYGDRTPFNSDCNEIAVFVVNIYNYDNVKSVECDWKLDSGSIDNFNILKKSIYECVLDRSYLEWYESNNKKGDCWYYIFPFGNTHYYECAPDIDSSKNGKKYYGNLASESSSKKDEFTRLAEFEIRKADLYVNDPDFDFDDADDVGYGPGQGADAAFVLMRNTDVMKQYKPNGDATANITITVTDKYGETYTSTKQVRGEK